MKEVPKEGITPEVEKAIGEAVDEDIEKIKAEEGEIEKSSPKLFGLDLGRILKMGKKRKEED